MTAVAGPPAAAVKADVNFAGAVLAPAGRFHPAVLQGEVYSAPSPVQHHNYPSASTQLSLPISASCWRTTLSRHANRVPIYSIHGGSKPLIFVSRKEAEELLNSGEVRRISRLKDPKLVMRFRALQKNPKRMNCSLTSQEAELHALAQILQSDGRAERLTIKRIAEKIAAWPVEGDEKATLAGRPTHE